MSDSNVYTSGGPFSVAREKGERRAKGEGSPLETSPLETANGMPQHPGDYSSPMLWSLAERVGSISRCAHWVIVKGRQYRGLPGSHTTKRQRE
jgi:hypothetical protein